MKMTEEILDSLTEQYRGEIAAIESYEKALKKYEDQPEEAELRRMYREHLDATLRLRETLREQGRVLPEGSGAWGTVASAVERVATIINDELPLQILRRGESIGVDGYDALLKGDGLSDALFVELAALRSRCARHMNTLDGMIARVPEIQSRPMI
jgi:hypothetical protein